MIEQAYASVRQPVLSFQPDVWLALLGKLWPWSRKARIYNTDAVVNAV